MSGETYTKLLSSITASTVWMEPHPTRIVWITMLAMANQYGQVHASVPGLAHIARVTREECEAALCTFMAPDPDSRNPANDGRRIEAIPGGWLLLNHASARGARDPEVRRQQNRESQARFREKIKQEVSGRKPEVSNVSQNQPIRSDQINSKQEQKSLVRQAARDEEFDLAWALYPKRGGGNSRADALKAWNARRRDGVSAEDMTAGVERYAQFIRTTGRERTEYVMQAVRFFGPGGHYLNDWSPPKPPAAAPSAPSKTMQAVYALEDMKNGLVHPRDHNGHSEALVLEASGMPCIGHDSRDRRRVD